MIRPPIAARWLPLLVLALLTVRIANGQSFEGCGIVPPPWEPVSFDADIQPIFDRRCVSCHQPGGQGFAQHQLDLRPGFAYRNLVGKPSAQNAAWPLLQPFQPDGPVGSLLWWKVSCVVPPIGTRMPPPGSMPLSSPEIRALFIWMFRGAPPGADGTGQMRAIEAAHGGTWYDPSLPGHGFSFDVVPGEPSRLIAFWMTFSPAGAPRWLVGIGEFGSGAASVELEIFTVLNGSFDLPQFRPNSVSIGNAKLSFSACDEAWMRYDIQIDLDAGAPRQQRTVALRRLTPSRLCEP